MKKRDIEKGKMRKQRITTMSVLGFPTIKNTSYMYEQKYIDILVLSIQPIRMAIEQLYKYENAIYER